MRGNLSFGFPNTHWVPEIAASGQKTPFLAMTIHTPCHCEARFVSRSNLSFGVPSFPYAWSFGTRDCRVGAKTVPPRNDGWGTTTHWETSLRALTSLSLRGPRSGPWQSLFWLPQYALGTRDCRVGAKNAPPRNDRWGYAGFRELSLRGVCLVTPKQSRSSFPRVLSL